jgi:hypothetical protein
MLNLKKEVINMYTWQHGFWIYFFTRHHPRVWQFVLGSMLPDYIYIFAVTMMLLHGQLAWSSLISMNPTVMMSLLPMYPWVVKIDLIGHSVVVWGIAFLLTSLPIGKRGQAFAIGWGTHLLIDGLTHGAYANHFLYPLSMLSVHSPVSYWEPQFFAQEFKMVNVIFMAMAFVYLLYERWKMKR